MNLDVVIVAIIECIGHFQIVDILRIKSGRHGSSILPDEQKILLKNMYKNNEFNSEVIFLSLWYYIQIILQMSMFSIFTYHQEMRVNILLNLIR